MSACAQLIDERAGEGDNRSAPFGLPQLDCGGSTRASNEEYIDRHGEAEVPHADIHSTVPDGVFRNFIHKYWQIFRHVHSLPPIPERVGIGTNPEKKLKAVTWVNADFRQGVDSVRQAGAETIHSGTVTSVLPA
jgi:hypothetical protein